MAVQAVQAETPAATPAAQVVGNAFVEQYYHILHQSPELVYRFYQDSSVLSRPDSSGAMCSATTMQEINERILSLTCKDFLAEIKTADAQNSLGDGVTVLVTGYLTETNSVKRKFAQSFFLAPQEKGYYVLNDVFRYVEDDHLTVAVPAAITENVPAAIQTPEPEPVSLVADLPEQVHETSNEEDLTNEPEVCDPSDIKDRSITEAEVTDAPLTHLDQSENVTITPVPSSAQVEEPKKSYASILKAMNANPSPMSSRVPAGDIKTRRPSSNREASGFAKPTQVSEGAASRSEAGPGKIDALEEDYSIYVRNLPPNATAAQVEEVFEKFGPLKQGGVQVRSNKQGFCFGFVEFQSPSPMKSAIEASPILIGGRKATVEEKKTTGRAAGNPNNGRGRYPSSRGGSRTDSFRGRAGFTGGRGYGRNDSRGPGEYSSRPRGPSGRGSESYQRADQNGAGNGGHQGEL